MMHPTSLPVTFNRMTGICSTQWNDRRQLTRIQRKAEKREVSRYVRAELAAPAPFDPLFDPTDCQHGCNGSCERFGSEVCTFLCHPSWVEMFGED
jgi:predicted NACHT family NTPase